MRFLIALLALISLPLAANEGEPDWGGRARADALATIERMDRGADRTRAALFVARNLMEAGRCADALPLLGGHLASAPADALAPLFVPAARAGDARCARPVANLYLARSADPAAAAIDRLTLRFRAAILFRLSGDEMRAALLDHDDLAPLAIVDRRDAVGRIDVGDTTIMLGYSNPPTLRQKVLLESFRALSGTPHLLPALQRLAARAGRERALLTDDAWSAIAVSLALAGDQPGALSLLTTIRARALSPAGLRAEIAIRAGRFAEAADMLRESGWHLRDEQRRLIARRAPLVLFAHIDEPAYWDGDPLQLADYAETLDAAGAGAESEAAAVAALAMFVGNYDRAYFCDRKARLLARLGRLDEAGACVQQAAREGEGTQARVAGRLIVGLAWRRDGVAIEHFYRGLSAALRPAALAWALSENCGYAPAFQAVLARKWLALRLPRRPRLAIGAARAGCAPFVVELLIGNGKDSNHLRYLAARSAFGGGHLASAQELAAWVAIGAAPGNDRLLGLSEIHARSGDLAAAYRTAARISSPAMRIRALIAVWRAAAAREAGNS